MKKNLKICSFVISSMLILACGMTATLPVSDGQKGSVVLTTATPINTLPAEVIIEEVGIVVADILTVRACPSEGCAALYYLERGDPVMGTCYYFEGEAWLGFDHRHDGPTKFLAVVFDGKRYVEGVCE